MKVLVVAALMVVMMVTFTQAVTWDFEPEECQGMGMCAMFCENGFQRAEDNGCVMCTCNDNLDHCDTRPLCRMGCPKFEVGPDGCKVCRCIFS